VASFRPGKALEAEPESFSPPVFEISPMLTSQGFNLRIHNLANSSSTRTSSRADRCHPFDPLKSGHNSGKHTGDSVASSDDDRPFNRDLLTNSQVLRHADLIVLWLGTLTMLCQSEGDGEN
jgi:hypothetical protein